MGKNTGSKNHIIIVSNRLSLIIKKTQEGEIQVGKGAGGLVTAMAPVLRNRNGIWIGWPGFVQETDNVDKVLPAIQSAITGYSVKPVMLSSDELKNYYERVLKLIVKKTK